jgi:hypothetical protein
MAKKPNITVSDRRVKDRLANPFGARSEEVKLTIPGTVARWFNAGLYADRIWRAKNQGWDPVTPDLLADKDQIGGFVTSAEGFVARGEKQQELLMYMAREDRDAIQKAKTEVNIRNMKMGRQRDEIAQAAAEAIGGQAADFLGKTRMVGNVTDQYERIQRDVVEE